MHYGMASITARKGRLMRTPDDPDRTAPPAPSGRASRPTSARRDRRTTLSYVGAAVAFALAMTLVDLVSHPRGTCSRLRTDDARTGGGAEERPQRTTADGNEPAVAWQEPAKRQRSRADSQGQGENRTTVLPSPWAWTMRRRVFVAVQAATALALSVVALAPPVQELAERNVRVHHLAHAALLGGGGILGLVLGLALRPPGHRLSWERHPQWRQIALGVVLLGPLVVMAAMVPSTSAWIDAHPLAHELEHLALIISGGVIGFSARLFSTALGWLVVALVAAMAAAFGAMALAHPLGLIVASMGVIMARI